MVVLFDNDENEYLKWVQANPGGFIANIDRTERMRQYPMVHLATHAALSSPKIGNFTTGDYIKVCSTDLEALERFAARYFRRGLTRCGQCM